MRAIHQREDFKPPKATQYTKIQKKLMCITATSPATPRDSNATSSIYFQQAATADCFFSRARMLSLSICLWYVSTIFLDEEGIGLFDVSSLTSKMCTSLNCAVEMFHNISWRANDACVLWISALGTLTSWQASEVDVFITICEQAQHRMPGSQMNLSLGRVCPFIYRSSALTQTGSDDHKQCIAIRATYQKGF